MSLLKPLPNPLFPHLIIIVFAMVTQNEQALLAQPTKASDLILALDDPQGLDPTFGCGQSAAKVEIAKSLVDIGLSVIPLIELKLGTNSAGISGSYGQAFWLEQIYARILGIAAFNFLKEREEGGVGGRGRKNLDRALAISLGITSYVSDSRSTGTTFNCTRRPEPRDALDTFILGWQLSDRNLYESSLSLKSKSSLDKLPPSRKSLAPEGRQTNHAQSHKAIGFKFHASNSWSYAEPAFEAAQPRNIDEDTITSHKVEIETTFTTSTGISCGRKRLNFLRTVENGNNVYKLDNTDILDLFKILASCVI